MKNRARRLDNGELVYGSHHQSADGKYHYILNLEKLLERDGDMMCLHKAEIHQIDPTTLAMETGKVDSKGVMIYGSIPVNGQMSKGGDIMFDYPSTYNVIYDKNKARFVLNRYSETLQDWLTCNTFNVTDLEITGKQFDNTKNEGV